MRRLHLSRLWWRRCRHAGGASMARLKRHHWIVRLTHWVNAVALLIMIGSGLRIFNAHPSFARIGESFCCYPFEGTPVPSWLTFGGWLAGARNWLTDLFGGYVWAR